MGRGLLEELMSVEGKTRVGNRLESYGPPSSAVFYILSFFFFSAVVLCAIPYNQSFLSFIPVPFFSPSPSSDAQYHQSQVQGRLLPAYSFLLVIIIIQGNKSFVAFSNLNDTESLTKTWKVQPSSQLLCFPLFKPLSHSGLHKSGELS